MCQHDGVWWVSFPIERESERERERESERERAREREAREGKKEIAGEGWIGEREVRRCGVVRRDIHGDRKWKTR